MAAGEREKAIKFGRSCVGFVLLSGATATNSGVWVEVAGLKPLNVYTVATAATVQIHGALASAKPASGTDGHIIATVTAGSRKMTLVSGAVKYVKSKVTARTAGTITSYAFGYGE